MASSSLSEFQSVPVIDVAPLFGSSEAAARAVSAEIRRASVEVGFFYVRGHTVPPPLMQGMLASAKAFFARPEAEKRRIQVNAAHRGYVPFAQTTLGRAYKPDLKESLNFAFPFQPGDPYLADTKPLIGLNQWPDDAPDLRRTAEAYYAAVFELGQRLLEGFALALDLERSFFRGLYRHPLVRARLVHYPPQPEGQAEGQFGAAPHTDWGCITVLWQDDVGGLQVRNRAGQWIDAPPIEGTFVINIGDMLERWSNDLFVSTPHRVVNASGRERYSIPIFYDPDFETVVECLPNCSSPDNPPKHPRTVAGEYITAQYDKAYAYRQKAS
ncbi:MAG TPA: 2-oxoglutarate and iron-dependent oxygenase domain-containing protein [Reyranella sp.]|nr:2-oxoglutarate and iron-dependent oxygenase domain-containing protein [Reyranella sp.]